ncbi:hypothetical protein HK102_001131 [Quaeritorhiza haematococci]|nr:hypothetical protein HK102_001131 [Quaeritorhiza haematococci]
MDAQKFARFFGGDVPIIDVPGFTYPVDEYWLEDILEATRFQISADMLFKSHLNVPYSNQRNFNDSYQEQKVYEYLRQTHSPDRLARYSPNTITSFAKWWKRYDPETQADTEKVVAMERWESQLVVCLLEYLWNRLVHGRNNHHIGDRGDVQLGAVLVFLPGWSDITNVKRSLEKHPILGRPDVPLILPLHSSINSTQQNRIFQRPPPGHFDPVSNASSLDLNWISQANASQRKGRAEILRVPLEEVCLQIKAIFTDAHGSSLAKGNRVVTNVAPFLAKCLDSPSQFAVETARVLLKDMGAFELRVEDDGGNGGAAVRSGLKYPMTRSMSSGPASSTSLLPRDETAGEESEKLTELGRALADLPVGPRIGKVLLYGLFFRCLDPILSITAALAYGRDIFVLPFTKEDRGAADAARMRIARVVERDYYHSIPGGGPSPENLFWEFQHNSKIGKPKDASSNKGSISDHLVILKVYNTWAGFFDQPHEEGTYAFVQVQQERWCEENFVNSQVLRHVSKLRLDLRRHLRESGMMTEPAGDAGMMTGLSSDGAGGFYPFVARVTYQEQIQKATITQKLQRKIEKKERVGGVHGNVDVEDQGVSGLVGIVGPFCAGPKRKRVQEADDVEGRYAKISLTEDEETDAEDFHAPALTSLETPTCNPGDQQQLIEQSQQTYTRSGFKCYVPTTSISVCSHKSSVLVIHRPLDRWIAYFDLARDGGKTEHQMMHEREQREK